jgi:prepilin-type processing-associated H-X9-DG protein
MGSEVFICPSADQDKDTFERNAIIRKVGECGNFGKVNEQLSYSYANPFGSTTAAITGFNMSNNTNPEFALVADKNPGTVGSSDNVYQTNIVNDGRTQLKYSNSNNHNKEGQNVLYADGHASFVDTAFCGYNKNHIYAPDTYINDPNLRTWSVDVNGVGVLEPGVAKLTTADYKPLVTNDSVMLPTDDGDVDGNP